ncbi:probable LRR receptor-like serine/threonine-protein kinase At3g47570 isoform X2 [Gossypium hirsutum]|uniref:Probable LRR receptor-like serine/threonine-protein kinase At3g47570 isoform X2 n=1 Tax=Gossypium hirsutum TaxID=3635 RepID=A0ABM2YUY6_GOSHI|nr:probable LRR receptor-like serine/threonine-protein kinase At3g47570 isoform X2 [Gossypium hirsutum]
MDLSKKHLEASSTSLLVFTEVIILLSCFNSLGHYFLGLATAATVIRGNDTDQQALLQFKSKITSDQLKVMESWNSSIHFCQWYGVTCSRKHQRVTKLELQLLKVSGSLSPYIGNLSFLRELNLAGNSFYNQIPQEIGRLRRLEILDLINNSIRGEIPSNLSACSKLTFVRMRSNQLTGEIPGSFGLLSKLKFLSFINNSLTGSIPPALGNLSSLEELYFTYNALSGILPEALGRLTNLTQFSADENAISGIIPTAMFNLSNIIAFSIGGNEIQGTLDPNLAITMPYVGALSVWGNRIYGEIPISISNASNLYQLQLDGNRLSGNVPSLEKLEKLFVLFLGENHLGYGREGDLNFICTLVNKTTLKYLDIGINNLGGVFPECVSNFSSNLLQLVIQQNKIWGRIPEGIANLINLETLGASRNQLSGPIPSDIGRLQNLKIFYASNNSLSGYIPHSIGNLTVLSKLALDFNNLQGTIPSSLGNCQNLLVIGLSHNNLSGPIHPQVLGLPSLSITLDLSSNYLTGELPVAVANLKSLGEFHVSKNKLSGLLPSSLGSCVSLEKLFLDGNLFEGPIPSSLSSLRGLEALDVSNNNLSGVIPSGGIFKNASATFVEGNSKLCGGIPELHMLRCNLKTSSSNSQRLKVAIIVVTLGVTLAFTCLLILWFRKKKEKQATTTSVENSFLQLSYQSILRATDGFSTQNLVGSGSFGSVYKGVLEASGAVIAVKVLNLLNRGASRSFLAECEALKNIRHRNLVKVLTAISGVDDQGNDFKALVYEFMENGSLEDWLHPVIGMNEPETARNLNFFQRVSMAIDVAHALEYLHHHCEEPIIHCDLKPSNILLDEEMVGHISDFGLAKILSTDRLNYSANKSSSLGLRGTIGYAAPEYGMGNELSTKGDVYSFGILLLEMFTGKRPTDEGFKEGLSLHNFVKEALPERVTDIIDPILLQERIKRETLNENSLGSDKDLRCWNSIFEIGLTCSSKSPHERIDMSDVVTKLCKIRDKLHPT